MTSLSRTRCSSMLSVPLHNSSCMNFLLDLGDYPGIRSPGSCTEHHCLVPSLSRRILRSWMLMLIELVVHTFTRMVLLSRDMTVCPMAVDPLRHAY